MRRVSFMASAAIRAAWCSLRASARMHRPLIAVAAAALLGIGASPADPPDLPVAYISVEDLKSLLDRKQRAVIIDVRTRPEYDALRVAGARSIPLRNMRERAAEIPRSGLVVLY